ncbi:MAG: hypothetical protein FJW38_23785 [Acidobacteria bacterium]|nr:hypothetical protein [Acidobacteriota bacterium]
MDRRTFLSAASLGLSAAVRKPVTAEVRTAGGKPSLFIRGERVYAGFYALTDCPGRRWSYDEGPRMAIKQFIGAGFKLFQLDIFLEDCWTAPDHFSIEPARKQLRGILDVCPEGAVVLRWHLNAPNWWKDKYPDELTRYANGDFEKQERTVPVRYIQDDLRRLPRNSLASEVWMRDAREKTAALLRGLAKPPEDALLAGAYVACGVYGEWHYWGFMRNQPDTSAPMQKHFAAWRASKGKDSIPVPPVEARRALDDGIFRDPVKRADVIDYYRCQQELVASRIIDLCGVAKKNRPRPILAGTFYGYFFRCSTVRRRTGICACMKFSRRAMWTT